MSVLEELGIVKDTNPLEALSFKKFSGISLSKNSIFLQKNNKLFPLFFFTLLFFVVVEIRIANEIHSPATKKKKEWQEKLPIVVLKAEEIMYSKANSEVHIFFLL